MKFLDEIARAGWDPTDPSPDCISATARPVMPEHLSEEDRLGIHQMLIRIDVARRFPEALGHGQADDEARDLAVVAQLHSLRAAGRDLTTLHPEEFAAHARAMDVWEHGRLKPAETRLEAAIAAGLGPQEIRPQFMEYEPALAYHTVLHSMGWTDWAGNRRAAAAAIKLAEERGVIAGEQRKMTTDLKDLVMTDGDVGDMIGLMLSKNPEQKLFHVTAEKKFCLGPKDARDALESVVGAVQHVRQKDSEPLPDDTDPAQDAEPTPFDAVVVNERMSLVRQFVQERRAQAASDSIQALVADNFERLKLGEISARALAETAGVSRATIDREVDALRADLLKLFGGDGLG